jgi:hypothetical protein
MFLELTVFTDESRNNTAKTMINTMNIMGIRRDYGDPQTGAILDLATDLDGVPVKETYEQIITALIDNDMVTKVAMYSAPVNVPPTIPL